MLYETPKRRAAPLIDRTPSSIKALILAFVGVTHSPVSWFLSGSKFMIVWWFTSKKLRSD